MSGEIHGQVAILSGVLNSNAFTAIKADISEATCGLRAVREAATSSGGSPRSTRSGVCRADATPLTRLLAGRDGFVDQQHSALRPI